VAVILCGSIPHAASVQKGAPEPPEKRDHCERVFVVLDIYANDEIFIYLRDAYRILMRIHEHSETVLFAFDEALDDVVHVFIVVYPTVGNK